MKKGILRCFIIYWFTFVAIMGMLSFCFYCLRKMNPSSAVSIEHAGWAGIAGFVAVTTMAVIVTIIEFQRGVN